MGEALAVGFIYLLQILLVAGICLLGLMLLFYILSKSFGSEKEKYVQEVSVPTFKIVRIDTLESDLNENIYEIVYINIEKGAKKKEVLVKGHPLYDEINRGKIRIGDTF